MTKTMVALALAAVSIAAPAQQDVREACRPDVQQYCAGAVGGGREEVKECLLDHQNDFSDACYDFMNKQSSDGAGRSGGGTWGQSGQSAPQGEAVYRSHLSNGKTVYSDLLPPDAASTRRVQFIDANSALPFR